jgi:deferrochelatase/peroxidase EfeB
MPSEWIAGGVRVLTDVTRRGLLRAAGAAGVAATAGSAVAASVGVAEPASRAGETLPFYGAHQQGIATPQQPALFLATFDLETSSVAKLRALMRNWSAAAARMTQGLRVAPDLQSGEVPPGDSGDVDGMLAGRLTVTFGFGARVFTLGGLAARRPAALQPLPRFAGERIEGRRSGGDLVVQACAEDAAIAFHAVRMLATLGAGTVRLRWTQRGFLPSRYRGDQTPRNLMGMKDGTLNPRPSQPGFAQVVWTDGSDAAWLRDGTYMVFRRIRMNLPHWDSSSRSDQEATIGRHRESGAPLGGSRENDTPNFRARDRNGRFVIPARAHIRLAHPSFNGGIEILRRGYSYDDGVTEIGPLTDGAPHSHAPGFNAGLAFVAFMRDPQAQFVPLQRRLAAQDRLNHYISHVGSAVFVVPPGARQGGYVGETLLG